MPEEKEWATLTPEEKREVRFKRWLEAPDVEFISPEARKAYRERVQRLQAVLLMKEPDRVPVSLMGGFFPIYYGGSTLHKIPKQKIYETIDYEICPWKSSV